MPRTSGLFIGLPAEFSPPERTAERIASFATRAEREALWIRIPPGWRPMIGHLACIAIATRIADDIPKLEERKAALDEVPEIWLEDVKALVKSLWATRDIRAKYREKQATRRAAEKEAA